MSNPGRDTVGRSVAAVHEADHSYIEPDGIMSGAC